MPKQTKYAHERRANNRDQKRIKERIQFQAIIDEFLSFEQLQQAQRSGSIVTLFEQVSQHLDQHQYSFALKRRFISSSVNVLFNTITQMMQTYHYLLNISSLFNARHCFSMRLG